MLGGGEWGIRSEENVSSLISSQITTKMKGFANDAAKRVARQKVEANVSERSERALRMTRILAIDLAK